jgi:hypothetical protein
LPHLGWWTVDLLGYCKVCFGSQPHEKPHVVVMLAIDMRKLGFDNYLKVMSYTPLEISVIDRPGSNFWK